MEFNGPSIEGLLDDPEIVETPEIENHDDVTEPLIPDNDNPDDNPDDKDDSGNDNHDNDGDKTNDDLITSYLKAKGIDPSKVQFENEDGGVDEVDFNTLSKEEQLTMLNELSNPYTEYENNVIAYLRRNNMSLQQVIDYFSKKAIDDFLEQNPDKAPKRQYSIDEYSDDELYMADLYAKYPEFSDEEIQDKLASAKANEELFNKEVAALRQYYKSEEDAAAENARLEQEEQYKALQRTITDAAERFNQIRLDVEDPTYVLDVEDSDRQDMLDYLLKFDTDGRSQLDKDLEDPKALVELAWLRTKGREVITATTRHFKKELANTRKELSNVKKELEKYKKNESNDSVTVRQKPSKKNNMDLFETWVS